MNASGPLEPSLVSYISDEQIQQIYTRSFEMNFIGRVLTEKYYQLCDERIYILRMARVAQRYKYLLENHAELVRRVPRGYIASYLNITLETLSRISKKG
jgi:hypothetical protein